MDYGLFFDINKQVRMIQYCNTNLLPKLPKNHYLLRIYYTKTMYNQQILTPNQFKPVLQKIKQTYSGELPSAKLMNHVIEKTNKSISKQYSIDWFDKQKILFKKELNKFSH
jgi:hypothetical protein